jgi:hypothetical protein
MATETSINTYTGVEGVVTYGGVAFAYCKMTLDFPRDIVKIPRGGKWSDLRLPGKIDPKIKIKYGLVDADLFIDAFDDGTNTTTTSDETLHAAIAGNGALQSIITGLTNPSVPMTIKLKIISTDGYATGAVTIIGTDAGDKLISETIAFPTVATGSTTTYYYGNTKFKTVTLITIPICLSANDNVTPYGAGQKNIALGKPKLVTITAKVMKSATQYTLITMTNCWLASMPLELASASDAVLPEQEVVVRDPDADITIQANL